MRLIAERFLTCTTLMLAASSVFAEVPPTAKLLNGTVTLAPTVAMPVSAHVTAPAIAWPVVHAPAQMEIVHMAPGATATIASEPAVAAAATAAPEVVIAAEPPPPPPTPTLLVDIDLSTQRMTVSENGAAKYTWAISSARAGYRTPTGSFKPTWMSKMWYSRQYDMAPMPHAVFFSGGVAIHATYATGMLGNPASHGCVRLAPKNAATFYSLVNKHTKDLTRIAVHGTPRANGPAMASNRRKGLQPYAYGSNGYIMVQNGTQVYGTLQGKVQQRRPYYPAQYSGQNSGQYGVALPGKKLKVAQRTSVASSTSGFGYGFGGF
jgi:lipoprotein-anchoring transpeptidase ErfK/SrfK